MHVSHSCRQHCGWCCIKAMHVNCYWMSAVLCAWYCIQAIFSYSWVSVTLCAWCWVKALHVSCSWVSLVPCALCCIETPYASCSWVSVALCAWCWVKAVHSSHLLRRVSSVSVFSVALRHQVSAFIVSHALCLCCWMPAALLVCVVECQQHSLFVLLNTSSTPCLCCSMPAALWFDISF